MIKNKITMHDLKKARWNLDQIKETMNTVDEEHCYKDFVIHTINAHIDEAIIYLNALKKDIK